MLELAFIFVFSRRIARIAHSKGRSAVGYVLFFILLWVSGEGGGVFLGLILNQTVDPGNPSLALMFLVGCPVLGVATATFISFKLVSYALPLNEHVNSNPIVPPDETYWNQRVRRDDDDRFL